MHREEAFLKLKMNFLHKKRTKRMQLVNFLRLLNLILVGRKRKIDFGKIL